MLTATVAIWPSWLTRISDTFLQTLGKGPGRRSIGAGEQNGELFAADPASRVNLAQFTLDEVGEMFEYSISHGVTEGIVYILEMVQIEHQHRSALSV